MEMHKSTVGRLGFGLALALGWGLVACGGEAPEPGGGPGGAPSESGSGGAAPSVGGGGGTGGTDTGGGGADTSGGGSGGGSGFNPYPVPDAEKMDLLFVIDNSVSMAKKVSIMGAAASRLVRRLTSPDCLAAGGERSPSVGGVCPAGTELEFRPVSDLHVGVITSSLGGSGSTSCASTGGNDRAQLLPKVRAGLDDPNGDGFLEWSAGDDALDLAALEDNLESQFAAVGATGCGFEATLEAMYRFLVDPSPPAGLVVTNTLASSTGVDEAILDQRAAFLRPDSLVAIVMLTDEDDCSVMQGGSYYENAGVGWLTGEIDSSIFRGFPPASAACADDPNDACCHSCLTAVPDGCFDTCGVGPVAPRDPELDRANLRCFEQKRRFGIDLLYPVQRYVDALTDERIIDAQTGEAADNPLFAGGQRGPGWVYLLDLVGVPWQDLATADSLTAPGSLHYLSPEELTVADIETEDGPVSRWELLLGSGGPPLDPFVIASIEPRVGEHPLRTAGGEPIASMVAPGSPGWNAINGHEFDNSVPSALDGRPANDDLQYACIFPLGADARLGCSPSDATCDCGEEPDKGRPLCKSVADGAAEAGKSQYWEKAYPAPRHYQVLRGLGARGVTASTCPKVTASGAEDFGYAPAMDALIAALLPALD
jgi:hypothetical protein